MAGATERRKTLQRVCFARSPAHQVRSVVNVQQHLIPLGSLQRNLWIPALMPPSSAASGGAGPCLHEGPAVAIVSVSEHARFGTAGTLDVRRGVDRSIFGGCSMVQVRSA